MTRSYLSEIHIYMHISNANLVRITCDSAVLYGTATSHGEIS